MTTRTIYIPLLNEGSPVSRPTQGIPMGDQTFMVLQTDNYDRAEEDWEFPPGSVVACESKIKEGKELLIARRLIEKKD